MDLAVGAIVEGKVTGITKFGAFVALPSTIAPTVKSIYAVFASVYF